MSAGRLPEPLVPADVDLRGLSYMPLLGGRLLSSDFALESTAEEFRRGLFLWWAAWNQVPAGSLPGSERSQAKLAGFVDESDPTWRAVKKVALRGFVKCSDGRLYHPTVCEQALIAWEKRAEQKGERENAAQRQRRTRLERKQLFAELAAVHVVPDFNVTMDTLRRLHAQHVVTRTDDVTVTPNVTQPVTQPVTVTDTAKTGRDVTGLLNTASKPPPLTTGEPERGLSPGSEVEDEGKAPAIDMQPPPPEIPPAPPPPSLLPSPQVAVCIALRRAGIGKVNPAHPKLLALVEAGATVDEFTANVDKARDMRDPFAYLLGVVEGQRKDAALMAASIHRGPKPTHETPFERARRERIAEMSGGLVSAPDPGRESPTILDAQDTLDAARTATPRLA